MYTTSDIGILYEGYVAALLMHAGYTVRSTPRSGDKGVDLLAYTPDDPARPWWCVECKYRSESKHDATLDPNVIRSVFTAAHLYEARQAALVTNADLTREAREIATQLGVWVIPASSSTWSYGAPVLPRPEELEANVTDPSSLGQAWRGFAEALRKPASLLEAPWLWIMADRDQVRQASEAVRRLAPNGVTVVGGNEVDLIDLREMLAGMQDGEVLLIENAERLPEEKWPILLAALESFRMGHTRLASFGCALTITRPLQMPSTRMDHVLRLSAAELISYARDVTDSSKLALDSVLPLYTAKDSVEHSVDVVPTKHNGQLAYACTVAVEWTTNAKSNWLGKIVKPRESGRDRWQVLVDPKTQVRLDLQTK